MVKRGLTLTITPATAQVSEKATYSTASGTVILEGKERGGLYYLIEFRCKALACDVTDPLDTKNDEPVTFFGLTANTPKAEFPRRLLEAHWAYGHLHFDKLRKLLGLGKGPNPDCPTCTLAKSKIDKSNPFYRPRSTRPHQRAHLLDVGFTRNNTYCFQIWVDDYTRYSYLDVMRDKKHVFEKFLTLTKFLDNKHAPYKLAYVRSDSDFIYTSKEWLEHSKSYG